MWHSRKRLVDGVVDHLVDHVVQARAIIRAPMYHARRLRTASRPLRTLIIFRILVGRVERWRAASAMGPFVMKARALSGWNQNSGVHGNGVRTG